MRDDNANLESAGPIAFVTGCYPGLSLTFIDREVRALRRAGCDVVTVTIRPPDRQSLRGGFQREEADRVYSVLGCARNPLTVLRALGTAVANPARLLATLSLALRARPAGPIVVYLRYAAYVLEAMILAEFLRRRGIVHAHNHLGDSSGTVTMLAAKLVGIPFSMTLHGPEVFDAADIWRLDVKIAHARSTVCISRDGREKALRHCLTEHSWKVVTIPCGITFAEYATDNVRTGRKLLFVGRLVPRKGVHVLVEALAMARNCGIAAELDIVGEGPEYPLLQSLVADRGLGDFVVFRGSLGEDGVANAMSKADVLVVPSLSEGLPVVIMEAMASGLPVIASDIDGIPELVRDAETGFLVPPGDSQKLAQALVRLLANPDLARSMGARGRMNVKERYDAERSAHALRRIFAQGATSVLF